MKRKPLNSHQMHSNLSKFTSAWQPTLLRQPIHYDPFFPIFFKQLISTEISMNPQRNIIQNLDDTPWQIILIKACWLSFRLTMFHAWKIVLLDFEVIALNIEGTRDRIIPKLCNYIKKCTPVSGNVKTRSVPSTAAVALVSKLSSEYYTMRYLLGGPRLLALFIWAEVQHISILKLKFWI